MRTAFFQAPGVFDLVHNKFASHHIDGSPSASALLSARRDHRVPVPSPSRLCGAPLNGQQAVQITGGRGDEHFQRFLSEFANKSRTTPMNVRGTRSLM